MTAIAHAFIIGDIGHEVCKGVEVRAGHLPTGGGEKGGGSSKQGVGASRVSWRAERGAHVGTGVGARRIQIVCKVVRVSGDAPT